MVALILSGCAEPEPVPERSLPPRSLEVHAALESTAMCGGGSPQIAWRGQPEETKSFALTLISPSEQGPWVHWMAWDIPAEHDVLPAGVLATHAPPTQGIGSGNVVGYEAPCPQGDGARYVLRVFALEATLGLPPTTTWPELGAAIQAHTLSWGVQDLEVSGVSD